MGESAEIRIGDAEREAAMTALGEHLSEGRLDVDEYGERSARVVAAKTRGELVQVFSDLPDPRPAFDDRPAVRRPPQYGQPLPAQGGVEAGASGEPAQRYNEQPVGQRLAAGLVPLSAIVAVVLFVTVVHVWWIFLLPAAAAVISGAILGENKHQVHEAQRHHREAMREMHRHQRDAMRQVRHGYRHGRRRDDD